MMRTAINRWRVVTLVPAVAAAAFAAACDPCFGVAGCDGPKRAGLTGRILDDVSGRPVAGVSVDILWRSGVELAIDSTRVHSNGDGLFSAEIDALGIGISFVDVVVSPPNAAPYRVRNVPVLVRPRRGESTVLPAWSSAPSLPDLGAAFRRGVPPTPLPETDVEFRRTGGTAVTGLINERFTTRTGPDGWFRFFSKQVVPQSGDELLGELTLDLPPFGPTTRPASVTPSPVFRPNAALHSFGFGPNLEYHFLVVDASDARRRVANVLVEFQRTGGIMVSQESWSVTTDASGLVVFPGRAEALGTLEGLLRVTPPAPSQPFERNITLTTFDADGIRFFDTLRVGTALPTQVGVRLSPGGAGSKP